MSVVASNIIVGWPSTAASIPSGWSRETSLDSKYIRGAATSADGGGTGGASTHDHTSPSHTPTQNSHTHQFYAVGNDASTYILSGTFGGTAADLLHGHSAKASLATTPTNNGVAITVNSTSNDLAYLEVIWIKSNGTPTAFPNGCVAFFTSDTLPTNWSRINGDKYLKGAAASGDGGGTGGANTHTHTSPEHTHTQNSHQHNPTASLTANIASPDGTGTDTTSSTSHIHGVGLTGATATNQGVTTTIDSANHEPVYTKLNTIQSSADTFPDDIIALWIGTVASIPTDWERYTTMDGKFCKGAAANGESASSTGGSATHSHTASNCQPTQNSHTHGNTNPGGGASTTSAPGTSSFFATPGHTHTWTVDAATGTNNAASVTIDSNSSESAYPSYVTALFIHWTGTAVSVVPRSFGIVMG